MTEKNRKLYDSVRLHQPWGNYVRWFVVTAGFPVVVIMDDEAYLTLDSKARQGTGCFASFRKEMSRPAPWSTSHTRSSLRRSSCSRQSVRGGCQSRSSSLRTCGQRGAVQHEVFTGTCKEGWYRVAGSDLGTYANRSLEKMERLKISVVPKNVNPPKVPQQRPIKNFLVNLKESELS